MIFRIWWRQLLVDNFWWSSDAFFFRRSFLQMLPSSDAIIFRCYFATQASFFIALICSSRTYTWIKFIYIFVYDPAQLNKYYHIQLTFFNNFLLSKLKFVLLNTFCFNRWVMLTGASGALVKQLKMERKNKVSIKSNSFWSFKEQNTHLSKKHFLL